MYPVAVYILVAIDFIVYEASKKLRMAVLFFLKVMRLSCNIFCHCIVFIRFLTKSLMKKLP